MLLEIAVALVFAKIFSMAFEKIKQPGVIGEIMAGILLGPCCIGLLTGASITLLNTKLFQFTLNLTTPEFKEFAFIGSVFLLFLIGLETNLNDLKQTKKTGLCVGVFGIVIPFLFGNLVGMLFHLTLIQGMAIGTIFLATSTTIAVRILSDMDLLATKVGLTLRTALVVNDVLAMVFFALVFGAGSSIVLLLQIVLFFSVTILVGFVVIRFALRKNAKRHAPIIVLTSGLATCFLFATFAENFGMTAIIGAFIAGIFIRKTPEANVLIDYSKTIGYAFFIPLFFVWIGANFNFLSILHSDQLTSLLIFCAVFIALAMLGNFLGSSLGARLSGMKRREAISVGIGMMPVMGVALIIVSAGIDRGIFGVPTSILANQIKVATLFLIFTSCIVSPVLLKRSMGSGMFNKSKTKLSSYHHPHCTECASPLRLDTVRGQWFCDVCDRVVYLPRKKPRHEPFRAYNSKSVQYVVGAATILICGLTIPDLGGGITVKLAALMGIFLGVFVAFLAIRHLFTGPKKLQG